MAIFQFGAVQGMLQSDYLYHAAEYAKQRCSEVNRSGSSDL
jgi:hypothetical protein